MTFSLLFLFRKYVLETQSFSKFISLPFANILLLWVVISLGSLDQLWQSLCFRFYGESSLDGERLAKLSEL